MRLASYEVVQVMGHLRLGVKVAMEFEQPHSF